MSGHFLPQEIIRQKRDGGALERDAIYSFIQGVTDGRVSDGQIGAFAMASLLNGMSRDETIALTLAMRDSGTVLQWPEIDRPILDKHSTGGVGDNVSLMLAPILAACGAAVPMISGRGLGHTGGTLDKLDAIPGYQSEPDEALFRQTVRDVGCAIIGQTSNLAPADKRLYAIRDVTATVESIPLITASILSKKLAAGLERLVLDVKFGSGAVATTPKEAKILAQSLVDVACGAGLPTQALLTNMDQPLAGCAGNALEVRAAIDFLAGHHQPPRLKEVTIALATVLLASSDLVKSQDDAKAKVCAALDSGRAAEIFERMVHALGGPSDLLSKADTHLSKAPFVQPIYAPKEGYIHHWDSRAIGMLVVKLGGGRRHPQDILDYAVGISDIAPIGAKITQHDPIAILHFRDQDQLAMAQSLLSQSITLSDEKPIIDPVITDIV